PAIALALTHWDELFAETPVEKAIESLFETSAYRPQASMQPVEIEDTAVFIGSRRSKVVGQPESGVFKLTGSAGRDVRLNWIFQISVQQNVAYALVKFEGRRIPPANRITDVTGERVSLPAHRHLLTSQSQTRQLMRLLWKVKLQN